MRARPVLLPVLGAVLAAAVLAAVPAAHAQAPAAPPATLAVDGTGLVAVRPDVARFDVFVRRTAATSARARALVAARVEGVLRVLRRAGVDEAAIRTEYLSVRRVRVRRGGRVRSLVRAETLLSVRSVPLDPVIALIDDVADAGGDLQGLEFFVADPAAGRREATREALDDARRRADEAAAQTGQRVTGVQSIDLDPQTDPREGFDEEAARGGGGGSTEVPVRPGQQEVVARVRVVYTIAPVV